MAQGKRASRAKAVTQEVVENPSESHAKHGRPLVFISHDSRDADLAELFAQLLSDVSGGTLKSFRSSDNKGSTGIPFGTEWYSAIMDQLDSATDVVALVTQHSVDRPWILYEAGVAKGKLDTVVIGVALGVPLERVSTGPFGQFQNLNDDEDSLTRLALQLLERNPDASPRAEAVRMHVRIFREQAAEILSKRGGDKPEKVDPTENVAALFEEVKAMVRDIPERLNSKSEIDYIGRARSSRRSKEMIYVVEELLYHPRYRSESQSPSAAWLIFVTYMRDDIPWLAKIGVDIYDSVHNGKTLEPLFDQFRELAMVNAGHSRSRGMMTDKETHSFIRHVPEMAEGLFPELLEEQKRRKRPIKGDKSPA